MTTSQKPSGNVEDLEGKCLALWVLNGGETEKWNGVSCDCKKYQGTYDCKLLHHV